MVYLFTNGQDTGVIKQEGFWSCWENFFRHGHFSTLTFVFLYAQCVYYKLRSILTKQPFLGRLACFLLSHNFEFYRLRTGAQAILCLFF